MRASRSAPTRANVALSRLPHSLSTGRKKSSSSAPKPLLGLSLFPRGPKASSLSHTAVPFHSCCFASTKPRNRFHSSVLFGPTLAHVYRRRETDTFARIGAGARSGGGHGTAKQSFSADKTLSCPLAAIWFSSSVSLWCMGSHALQVSVQIDGCLNRILADFLTLSSLATSSRKISQRKETDFWVIA